MRYAFFTVSFLLALPLAGCTLPDLDDEDSGGTGDATDGETTPTTSSSGSESGSTESTTSPETTDESGSESGESGGSTTDDPMPSMCADATLFAGNPYFTGDLEGWMPEGQPLLADPPLRSRHLAVTGGQLAIETQQEVWIADDTQVRRIAGDELEPEPQYQPSGACEDVRMIIGHGIAGLPNGNLVLVDTRGNGVIELSDPLGTCMASPIAGNQEPILDLDIADDVANPGDVEGPGAQAMFYAPERPTADDEGNVYLWDSGNGKVKRIAADADRTVSTVWDPTEDEGFVLSMTAMNGTLYVAGQNVTDDFLVAVDPETGMANELFRGRGIFEQLDSSQQATLFAMSNDGVDLLLASNKGYVFRVSTSGEPLGVVAGMGQIVDYPDLDLTHAVALDQLPLRSFATADANLVRMGSDFMFTGNANGVGYHIWRINCG